jgi:hypothetical protein
MCKKIKHFLLVTSFTAAFSATGAGEVRALDDTCGSKETFENFEKIVSNNVPRVVGSVGFLIGLWKSVQASTFIPVCTTGGVWCVYELASKWIGKTHALTTETEGWEGLVGVSWS